MKRIVFPLSVMVMGLMSCQSHGPFIPTKTKVILVDTVEFKNLCGKAEHHKSYLPQVTTNP